MEKYSVISPDLTRNDTADARLPREAAQKITALCFRWPNRLKRAGLLWAGTDDGRLWMTENEGGKWTELTDNLPEPARGQWVSRIEPSQSDANVAYVATNGYRIG